MAILEMGEHSQIPTASDLTDRGESVVLLCTKLRIDMNGKWHLWRWLALAFILFGIVLAMFLPMFTSSGNPSDFEWRSVRLRIFNFALICFFIVGLLMAVKFTRNIFRFARNVFRWLFSWHALKLFLRAFAALAFLSWLFFYVEENWRVKRAWENYRQEWEAKGEHFDFASFVPKPVSDDRNFALTPIVATSYEWMLDKHGNKIIPPKTNVVERLYMQIYGDYNPDDRSFDYPTNQGNWKIGQKIDLKGFQLYYRALAAKTNEFPIPPQPQSPAADVLLGLSKFDSDIEELRSASRLPDSRFPLNYDALFPAPVYLMHLSPVKTCSEFLRLRAVAELQNGQSDMALADVNLSLRLIDSIRTEPFLISHLIRIGMLNMTIQPVWEGLSEHRWSDAQLAELDQKLARLDFLTDYEFAARSERATALEAIDYMRRTRNFDMMESDVNMSGPEPKEPKMEALKKRAELVIFQLAPSSIFYQNELNFARTFQQSLLPAVNVEERTVSPSQVAGKLDEHWSPNNPLANTRLPALGYALRKFAYAQSSVDMARVACALERYQLAHGQYPEKLDALAPQFMEIVPHDIIGGQPLHYHLLNDGQFVLYSVGWNETDDGGFVFFRDHSTSWIDETKSDWVWHYPIR